MKSLLATIYDEDAEMFFHGTELLAHEGLRDAVPFPGPGKLSSSTRSQKTLRLSICIVSTAIAWLVYFSPNSCGLTSRHFHGIVIKIANGRCLKGLTILIEQTLLNTRLARADSRFEGIERETNRR